MTGTLREINRYPVKSMLGESLTEAQATASGLVHDRAWGVVQIETGKVASAKHPQLWANLLGLRARSRGGEAGVNIDLPGGETITSDDDAVHAQLSSVLGREVRLRTQPPEGTSFEEVWPDIPGIAPEEFITATRTGATEDAEDISSLPVGGLTPGTFQDLAPITILTTSSLRAAELQSPHAQWDPRRFRSTLLIDTDEEGFVENGWVGRRLSIGDVELEVTAPIPRCVMVTLAQQDLPGEPAILRTLAKHNRLDTFGVGRFACLGVYATVHQPGIIKTGQPIKLF